MNFVTQDTTSTVQWRGSNGLSAFSPTDP